MPEQSYHQPNFSSQLDHAEAEELQAEEQAGFKPG